MLLPLLLLLACKPSPPPDAATVTTEVPPAPEGSPPAAGGAAAEGDGPPPAPPEDGDEEDARVPSDLSGIDAEAAQDPGAQELARAMLAALDNEDAAAIVELLDAPLKEEEGPGMFESFVEDGTTIAAGAPSYLGQRDGRHHYLAQLTVTEPAQAQGEASTDQLLRFHLQVAQDAQGQWKVVGLNAWGPEDE